MTFLTVYLLTYRSVFCCVYVADFQNSDNDTTTGTTDHVIEANLPRWHCHQQNPNVCTRDRTASRA